MEKTTKFSLGKIRYMHFIGIFGISVSSLAVLCARRGYAVSGSDSGEGTPERRRMLTDAGVKVFYGNSPDNLPRGVPAYEVAVVYSAAIGENNAELSAARRMGMLVMGRTELMELITFEIPLRLGVAGTHGKSTVCGMLAEIFLAAGADPDVLCGAELPSMGGAWRAGSGERIIYEACEYKCSFLSLHPTCAIVTNIEEEHVDHFRDMEHIRASFYEYAVGAEKTVVCIDGAEGRLLAERLGAKAVTCSVGLVGADYRAESVRAEYGRYSFELVSRGKSLCSVSLRVVGKHNLSNAVVAAAAAMENGIAPIFIADGLQRFCGVRRRMEYRGMLNGAVIYDDYAHHPTEIRATLAAAREMGFRFISCAFQPHTYSRTAHFFCEFANAFYEADEVVFADIYAAREENVFDISSKELATVTKNGFYLPTPRLIAEHFRNIAAPGVLLLTMGAGVLDCVADILLKADS